jgi:hypothetical protein
VTSVRRTAKLSIWVSDAGRLAVEQLAAAEERSVSDMARILLAEAMRARAQRKT